MHLIPLPLDKTDLVNSYMLASQSKHFYIHSNRTGVLSLVEFQVTSELSIWSLRMTDEVVPTVEEFRIHSMELIWDNWEMPTLRLSKGCIFRLSKKLSVFMLEEFFWRWWRKQASVGQFMYFFKVPPPYSSAKTHSISICRPLENSRNRISRWGQMLWERNDPHQSVHCTWWIVGSCRSHTCWWGRHYY